MLKKSKKVENIPLSPIRKIFDRVNTMTTKGIDVISLGIGEPDFDTPEHIKEAMFKATKKGETHYTANKGIVELRSAICDKLLEDNGLVYDVEEIICTVGVSEAVYIAMSSYLDVGDEVLIPDPSWLNYSHVATLNGAMPIYYPLSEENNYQIDISDLERLVTDRTRIIVILDPSNPTGGVLEKSCLEEVARFAYKHDILIISDEIYEKIIYDDNKHHSIAEIEKMRERTIVLNGFAKAYAMTGWRLGYLAAPKKLINPLLKIHSYMVTSACSMVQWGGIAALKGTQKPLNMMVEEFKIRRDFVVENINKINGLSCSLPKGAFYVFVDVSRTGMDGESFAEYLLNEAKVATVPGTAFGKNAKHHIRISYATSLENLKQAMIYINEACNRL